jgi:hypothetical protein
MKCCSNAVTDASAAMLQVLVRSEPLETTCEANIAVVGVPRSQPSRSGIITAAMQPGPKYAPPCLV